MGWTWYTWLSYYIPVFGWIRTYNWKAWLMVGGAGQRWCAAAAAAGPPAGQRTPHARTQGSAVLIGVLPCACVCSLCSGTWLPACPPLPWSSPRWVPCPPLPAPACTLGEPASQPASQPVEVLHSCQPNRVPTLPLPPENCCCYRHAGHVVCQPGGAALRLRPVWRLCALHRLRHAGHLPAAGTPPQLSSATAALCCAAMPLLPTR